jgi:hypothetical protein
MHKRLVFALMAYLSLLAITAGSLWYLGGTISGVYQVVAGYTLVGFIFIAGVWLVFFGILRVMYSKIYDFWSEYKTPGRRKGANSIGGR